MNTPEPKSTEPPIVSALQAFVNRAMGLHREAMMICREICNRNDRQRDEHFAICQSLDKADDVLREHLRSAPKWLAANEVESSLKTRGGIEPMVCSHPHDRVITEEDGNELVPWTTHKCLDCGAEQGPHTGGMWRVKAERPAAPAQPEWHFVWLLELFEPWDSGNSLGVYYTGQKHITGEPRTTPQAHFARPYVTKYLAMAEAEKLEAMAGVWRPVEHGFAHCEDRSLLGQDSAAPSGALAQLCSRLRLLEKDHSPEGWPAVQMKDISALLDVVQQPKGNE